MPEVTAYPSLSPALANDVLPVVDVNDTAQSASGTSKQVSVATLLGAVVTTNSSATGTVNLDPTTARVFNVTETGNTTFTFNGVAGSLASGTSYTITLYLTPGTSTTTTFPGSVSWIGGTAPTLTASTLNLLVFQTFNSGTTWHGAMVQGGTTADVAASALLTPLSGAGVYPLGTDAYYNMSIGSPLADITPGPYSSNLAEYNTGIGWTVLDSLTAGYMNCALGSACLGMLTTGIQNTAIGMSSLGSVVTGNGNVAVGYNALGSYTGSNNTALGVEALSSCTSGTTCTATGHLALAQVTTGGDNVGDGQAAGYGIVTGINNACIGANAGYTDGTNTTTDQSAMTLLGANAQATVSNVIVLGASGSVTTMPNLIFGAAGASAAFGSGQGVFAIPNAATAPSSNPTGGGVLYVASGALKWRGSSGTVTTIANA